MFAATPPVVGHIETGKLRALAVTGEQRVPALKNVPTMAEAGMPGFTMHDWQGILVKAGTPTEIVDRLNKALRAALASDDVAQAFARLGSDRAPGSPAEFGALIAETMSSLNQLVKSANIRVQ
jgi:tripartite-type tricarboxylate transporter receptor subunit TctC